MAELTAEQIRNIWRKKRPEGLSKSEVETMPDPDVLDLYYILDETLDEIFQNADEIELFELDIHPICDCRARKFRR